MALIEWKEEYSVGNATLDQDHKRLIDLINRVAEAEERGGSVSWAIEELQDYVRTHFEREEGLMAGAGYADLQAHKQEHRAFTEWLNSVKSTLHLDASAQHLLATTIKSHLRDWLNGHILHSDMAYKGKLD